MKFATLALIGAASAKTSVAEKNLTSNVRAHYPAATVQGAQAIGQEIMATLQEARAAMEAAEPEFTEAQAERFFNRQAARYGPDLQAWDSSASVRAARNHEENQVAHSAEFRRMVADGARLYNQASSGRFDAGMSMNADGSYDEWISNESARQIFEELYHIAQDVNTFIRSPVVQRQRALDRLTLNDPAAARIFQRLQDDLNIHSWETLDQRLTQLGRRIRRELRSCPFVARLRDQVMRLQRLVESTRVVSDMGAQGEWENWWNQGHFANPFEGLSERDFDFLL